MSRRHSLPILLVRTTGQRFDCHACTHCCRELVVRLLPSDRERIDARGWDQVLDVPPYVKLHGDYVLNKRPDGRCVFLEDDGKCRIHREHGRREKPLACQLFPFRIVPSAEKWRVGWRFDCPTIARSEGGPVLNHEPDVKHLASQLSVAALEVAGIRPGVAMEEAGADAIARWGRTWLGRDDLPFSKRLFMMASLASLLADPAFAAVSGETFVQLIDSLGSALKEAEDRPLPPASDGQRGMLRQAAFAHCEHVSLAQARSAWRRVGLRWSQLRRARRFRRGRGMVPSLSPSSRCVSFETLETIAPASADAESIEELMARYLRVILDSRAFYGPAYYGWRVREGFAALTLRVPLIGWLARHHAAAAGRDAVAFEDVVTAVGQVDGTAGRVKAPRPTAGRTGEDKPEIQSHFFFSYSLLFF